MESFGLINHNSQTNGLYYAAATFLKQQILIMSTAATATVSSHPASLTKSSTSISGASSVSSVDIIYSNPAVETKCPSVDQDVSLNLNTIASSRNTHRHRGSTSAPQQSLAIFHRCDQITPYRRRTYKAAPTKNVPRAAQPHLIASISVGFERGDYLVREEKGFNVYFYFLEEAYNFIVQKGFSRMPKYEENDYMELIKRAQRSVPGGCRYNNGKLLMVLKKKLVPVIVCEEKSTSSNSNSSDSNERRSKSKRPKNLSNSSTTLPTDDETVDESSASSGSCSYERSNSITYDQSSCSTSVDSWE